MAPLEPDKEKTRAAVGLLRGKPVSDAAMQKHWPGLSREEVLRQIALDQRHKRRQTAGQLLEARHTQVYDKWGLLTRGAWYRKAGEMLGIGALHQEPRGAPSGEFDVHYVDVDGLKLINDNLGHSYGDVLLETVAKTLKEFSREHGGAVTRPHGMASDEFIWMTRHGSPQETARVRDELRQRVAESLLKIPEFRALRGSIAARRVGASIGTASLVHETPRPNLRGRILNVLGGPLMLFRRRVPGVPAWQVGIKDPYRSHHFITHAGYYRMFGERYGGMAENRVDKFIQGLTEIGDPLAMREKRIKRATRRR